MKKLVIAKVLAGAGVAVAASAAGAAFSSPDAATDGLDNANTHAAVEVPAAGGLQDEAPRHEDAEPEDEAVEVEVNDTDDADAADTDDADEAQAQDAPSPQGEHGAAVVAAVEASEPGPERGEAVSSVASDGRADEGRANAEDAGAGHRPDDAGQ